MIKFLIELRNLQSRDQKCKVNTNFHIELSFVAVYFLEKKLYYKNIYPETSKITTEIFQKRGVSSIREVFLPW